MGRRAAPPVSTSTSDLLHPRHSDLRRDHAPTTLASGFSRTSSSAALRPARLCKHEARRGKTPSRRHRLAPWRSGRARPLAVIVHAVYPAAPHAVFYGLRSRQPEARREMLAVGRQGLLITTIMLMADRSVDSHLELFHEETANSPIAWYCCAKLYFRTAEYVLAGLRNGKAAQRLETVARWTATATRMGCCLDTHSKTS